MPARKLKQAPGGSYYRKIRSIDGSHPFKEKVPGAYVEYEARTRKNGKITAFNFRLAKEMGLIPADHPEELNPDLEDALLDTFALIIINEWDIKNRKRYPSEEIKPNRYMATRYLQLQHPDKIGLRSGDGRSIWNGYFNGKGGITWDISSCGTGATCLSPAAVINDTFYKSGDKNISYGCGYSHLSEGVIDFMFSEIFHNNDILTERVLCVLEFPGSFGITVRAGMNLLRPSHFFNHLRQGQLTRLKNALDFFIDREIDNGTWQPVPRKQNRYDYLVDQMATTFANICANFEVKYIFCWLDWDGDNILANGGIIDFGSVRQFGLYHHSYKFDDDDRWSTNLKEQKYKAKHIIMSFAQAADFIKTGTKKPHSHFKNHRSLRDFDKTFAQNKRSYLLEALGFDEESVEILSAKNFRFIRQFEKVFYQFESARSKKGPVRVPDGINWNAIYCMRDILRELPNHLLETGEEMAPKKFLDTMASQYAGRRAKIVTQHRRRQVATFQKTYLRMVAFVAKKKNVESSDILKELARVQSSSTGLNGSRVIPSVTLVKK